MRIIGLARVAVAAMLLGLAACAGTTETTSKSWPEFRMPGADFAVSLPATPQVSEDVTAKDGSISRAYHVEEGALSYTVAYASSTPKAQKGVTLDGWLDATRDALVSKMGGKLRVERRFSLGDSRGMEFLLDVPPQNGSKEAYTVKGRIYVKHAGSGKNIRDVLYQTLVVSNPGGEKTAAVTRFLDSFHFVAG
jgi:hypothetical protein